MQRPTCQGVDRQGQPRDYRRYRDNYDQQGHYRGYPNHRSAEYPSSHNNVVHHVNRDCDDGGRGLGPGRERWDRSTTFDQNNRQSSMSVDRGYNYSRDEYPRNIYYDKTREEEEGRKRTREEEEGRKRNRDNHEPPPEHPRSSAPKISDNASPSVKKRPAAAGAGEGMEALPGLPKPLLLPHKLGLPVEEQAAAMVAPSSFTTDIQLEEEERAPPSTSKTFMTTSSASGHQQGTPSRPPSSSPPGLCDGKEGETTCQQQQQQEDMGLEGLQQLQVDKEQGGTTPPPAPCAVPLIQPAAVTEPAAPLEAGITPPAVQGVAVPPVAGPLQLTGMGNTYIGPDGQFVYHWMPNQQYWANRQ